MKKISIWGINALLLNHLEGIYFYEEILSKIKPSIDEDGNIADHFIDNIKTSLKVALCFAIKADNEMSGKLRRALISLLDYGTEESSNNIREFLQSQESKSPSIMSGMPTDAKEQSIGNLFLSTDKVRKNPQSNQGAILLNLIMNQTRQNFDAK